MRRLYFLLPSVDSARSVVDELLTKQVDEKHIHVLARRGTPLEDLPQTSVAQRTDLIPALERGVAVGGATGALAGLVAVTVPPAGLVLGGGAIIGMALAGAGFGAWASSLLGVSTPNSQIKRFEEAIERGELLMMVDVPKERVDEIEEVIKRHHPEAEIGGTEPTVPRSL
jgi:outer membrane receptor protein involved in Fe transport